MGDWTRVRLSERLVDVVTGKTPPTSNPENYPW